MMYQVVRLYLGYLFFVCPHMCSDLVQCPAQLSCMDNFHNYQVVRLYLGYLGNLGERVPELAGFWLLTILLQLPMQVSIKAAQCS